MYYMCPMHKVSFVCNILGTKHPDILKKLFKKLWTIEPVSFSITFERIHVLWNILNVIKFIGYFPCKTTTQETMYGR